MKKITLLETETIIGGGAKCDFASGVMAGWGLGGIIVGGIAASGGLALALGGIALSIYCAG